MKTQRTPVIVAIALFAFMGTLGPALTSNPAHSFQQFPGEVPLGEPQTLAISSAVEVPILERDTFEAMTRYEVLRQKGVNMGAYLMATSTSIQLHDPSDGTVIYPLLSWNFNYKDHAYMSEYRPNHNGVDMAIGAGTPIFVIADGVVTKVGNDPNVSHGYHVRVQHTIGGRQVESGYAHMVAPPPVHVGQQVTKGDVIGNVGSTGESTGNHLHFEIRIDGVKQDPASWLMLNAIR